jgi:hypothetical protein
MYSISKQAPIHFAAKNSINGTTRQQGTKPAEAGELTEPVENAENAENAEDAICFGCLRGL